MNEGWRDLPLAVVMLLLLYEKIIAPLLKGKNGNKTAGEQSVVYYDSRFDAIDKSMEDAIDRQKDIHRLVIGIAARQKRADD